MSIGNVFYVYELIDPRTNTPFYIGKGMGPRINNYLTQYPVVNQHTKTVLEEIALSGNKVDVRFISESMDEEDALSLEKTLIKKYGRLTKDPGGILTNIRSSDHTRKHPIKNPTKNTTVQISMDIGKAIRNFCREHGLIASTTTEKFWKRFISSSAKLDIPSNITNDQKMEYIWAAYVSSSIKGV